MSGFRLMRQSEHILDMLDLVDKCTYASQLLSAFGCVVQAKKHVHNVRYW